MAWKVLSNLKTEVLHKAGEILESLENLTEEEIKALERDGIIRNLKMQAKADEQTIASQVDQDAHTIAAQVEADAELARGQVDSQVNNHAQQDIAAAEELANAPGDPVVNNHAQPAQQ